MTLAPMINILSDSITARHRFIFNVIFKHWLNTDYNVIRKIEEHTDDRIPLITYTSSSHGKGIHIQPSGLLDENEIKSFIPRSRADQKGWHLFPGNGSETTINFDVFSAIFWMISRYEEYGRFTPDQHGRFDYDHSLCYRQGNHREPVVDLWVDQLAQALERSGAGFSRRFVFSPTYDIDQTWAYKHKGFIRNTAGLFRDMLTFKPGDVGLRLRVLSGRREDPYDCFSYLDQLHDRYHLRPIYFIHPGTYGTFDKNIPLKHKAQKGFIRKISDRYEVGIHPSYRASTDPFLLRSEIESLGEVCGRPITQCRFHFLKIQLPHSYRTLIKCGIREDHSLGWAGDNGYRAGTGRAFPFYDLEQECETDLMIYPLVFMDGAYKIHQGLSIDEAKTAVLQLMDVSKKMKGRFSTLWHNESLGATPRWSGWREVYETIIKFAQE